MLEAYTDVRRKIARDPRRHKEVQRADEVIFALQHDDDLKGDQQ